MPTDIATVTLNRQTRQIWMALKRLTQKLVHDSNNIFGAIQGYLSLLEMSPDGNEQLQKYLVSMQEALDSGIGRNKALAGFYRQTEVMMIETDPLALAKAAADQFADAHRFEVELHAPEDIAPLRLEEPIFSNLITYLCHLLLTAAAGDPVIALSMQSLDEKQLGDFVMESPPGDYLLVQVHADASELGGAATFLEPFQMPISEDAALGMGELFPIISNHGGNLDLQLEQEILTLNAYFPYKAA